MAKKKKRIEGVWEHTGWATRLRKSGKKKKNRGGRGSVLGELLG